MQHGRVVQVGQVGHVVALVVLGRIHLLNVVFFDGDELAFAVLDGNLFAFGALYFGRNEALLVVGYPAVLLAVERLRLHLDLLLFGHKQVLE